MTDTHSPLWQQVNVFLRYLRVGRQLSSKTRKSYFWQLTTLIAMASEMWFTEWRQLEISQVQAHTLATSSNRQGLQPTNLALWLSALSALHSLLDWLVSIANPAQGVPALHHDRYLPKNMDVDKVDHLLEIDNHDSLALRDRAMLKVMYGAWLRLAELVGLNCANFDLGCGEVRVVGKVNKERKLSIGPTAVAWLTPWRVLHDQYSPQNDAVFIAQHGGLISVHNVQKSFTEWGVRQGVNSYIHPRKLRHSFATHILESSGNLLAVQKLLGHANLSTTQIYTPLDFQHLASVYDAVHPRAKREKPDAFLSPSARAARINL